MEVNTGIRLEPHANRPPQSFKYFSSLSFSFDMSEEMTQSISTDLRETVSTLEHLGDLDTTEVPVSTEVVQTSGVFGQVH